MSWTQIFNDAFARADGPVGNGWVDANSAWSIASGVAGSASTGFAADTLTRPASEYSGVTDQRVVVKATTATDGTFSTPLAWLRKQAGSASGYVCWAGQNSSGPCLAYGRMDAGTLTLDNTNAAPGLAGSTDVIITFDAVGATITCSVALASDPSTPLVSFTKTDSTYTSGTVGLSPLAGPNHVKRFTAFGPTPPDTSTTRVVCSGNSQTEGQSLDVTAIPYPTSLATLLGPSYSVVNSGIGGQTGAQILADFTAQVGSHYDASKSDVLVLWEGTNDLYFNATPSASYGHLVSICQAWKALNAANRAYVLTVLPRGDFPGTSTIAGDAAAQGTTFEAGRQTLNGLIRANTTDFVVIDVADDSRIGAPGADLDTTWYDASTVHLNAAGYALVAQLVRDAILAPPVDVPSSPVRAVIMPSGESLLVYPLDPDGNPVQVLAIQSGNAEQLISPSNATVDGSFALTFGGQTTAPIAYTVAGPGTVHLPPDGQYALWHDIPVTPGLAVDLSLTVPPNNTSFFARNVLCEVIEGTFVRAHANFNQDNIGPGSFTTPNTLNGGAGVSTWVLVFPGYVPTTSSLSLRMTAPIDATPQSQSIWLADGLHVREVVSGAVATYDDRFPANFSAVGNGGFSDGGIPSNFQGSYRIFPYGGGTGSIVAVNAADVKAKFEALSSVGSNNTNVTVDGNGTVTIEFVNALGAQAIADITSTSPALAFTRIAGGSVPTLHVTHGDGSATDYPLRQKWIPSRTGLNWASYVLDGASLGTRFLATDRAAITIPDGWLNIPGGFLTPGTYPVENLVDGTLVPQFVIGPKTMGVGQGIQPDLYYSEGGPAFVNMACRSGASHIAPLANGAFAAWDANGDPTLMLHDSQLAIINEPGQGSHDGVGGILVKNAPAGLYTFTWDGPFAGGGVSGQNGTFAERMDLQVQSNTTNNRRVYDIQPDLSVRASATIYWTWLASGPADGNGLFPCTTKNLRVYPPDPADPTGQTPWLNPTGKFHPAYLRKLKTCRDVRPMQALDTFNNPYRDFDQIKPVNWLDRSGPQISRRVKMTRIAQYTGAALDNPHSILVQITTDQPHGFFTGQTIALENCGVVQLSSPILVNNILQSTIALGEHAELGTASIDVIDATNFVWHMATAVLPDGSKVNGVTMVNVITDADVFGAARGAIGTSFTLEDCVDLLNDLNAAYPGIPRCLWMNIPVTASDGCIDLIAAYIAAHLSPGITCIAEYGNECWNFNYATYTWCKIRNFQVFGATDDTYAKAYSFGQINVNVKFQAAFDAASRSADFSHVFAVQTSGTANTDIILAYALSVGARCDKVAIAPYLNNYNPPDFDKARSNLFTVGMCLDLWEANAVDDGIDYVNPNYDRVKVYYPSARMVTYEGGPEALIPGLSGGASSGNGFLFSNMYPLQHAIHRHPRFFPIGLHILQSFQDQGIDLWTNFFAFGGSQSEAWSTWEWCDQQPGTGDPAENPDYNNTSALTSGGQVPVVSQWGGVLDYWNNIVGAGFAPLVSGTLTPGSVTNTTVGATATDATGGAGSFTRQWFRSTVLGQLGAPVAGQTSLALADSGLTLGTTYYYTIKYTDAGIGSVHSGQISLTTTGTTPTLTVSPTSGTAIDGQTTLAITATFDPSLGGIVATVSGGGTISTNFPTNGVPFTYTPPTSGTGTATVSVGDGKALEATCVVSYAPAGIVPATVPFALIYDILDLRDA